MGDVSTGHSSTQSTSAVAPRQHHRRIILILGALTAFGPMAIDLYLPAFPDITRDLQTNTGNVELTVSLFLLGLGLGQLAFGPISDRIGRRIPLIFGAAVFAVAAIGSAFTHSIHILIAWRILMALGGAAGSVVARAVVRDLFEPRESAHVYSTLMLIMGSVPILAPVIGGQLVGLFGWRGLFGIMAVFGLFCSTIVATGLPESLPTNRRSSDSLWTAFQRYVQLLRNRHFVGVTAAGGLISGMMFAYITGIATILMGIHEISPKAFGLCFGINAAGLICGSQYNRLLLKNHTPDAILRAALLVILASNFLLLIHAISGIGGLPLLLVLLFVILATTGVVYPNTTTIALAPFPKAAGSASALFGASQFAIGFIAGSLVSLFHTGGAIPMVGIMFICSLSAWLFIRRWQAA